MKASYFGSVMVGFLAVWGIQAVSLFLLRVCRRRGITGISNPSGSRFVLQFDRLAVRCSSISVGPGFFAFEQGGRVRQVRRYHEALQRCQPTVVVARSVIWFTTLCVDLQLVSQRFRPFLPRKMPLRGQPNSERECRCLPWLGKDRVTFIAW